MDLIARLRERLKSRLPGTAAQKQMLALPVSGQKFNFRHPGPPKQGGVALILYPKQGRWMIPLMKRPAYTGIHGGQISFPGGRMEPEDADLTQTAIRETNEEIGVTIERDQVIGNLSPLYIRASHYEVLPVVAVASGVPDFQLDPREVQDLIEAELPVLLQPDTRQSKQIEVRGISIQAPYFDVQEEVVWGATAMILNEFLTVVRGLDGADNGFL